jgi:hypothetical protein
MDYLMKENQLIGAKLLTSNHSRATSDLEGKTNDLVGIEDQLD